MGLTSGKPECKDVTCGDISRLLEGKVGRTRNTTVGTKIATKFAAIAASMLGWSATATFPYFIIMWSRAHEDEGESCR